MGEFPSVAFNAILDTIGNEDEEEVLSFSTKESDLPRAG